MVNVEKFEEFSTCIYRFKHKFENTDRKNMLDFILLESMKQEGNEKFQRLGSQLNDRLHDNDIFKCTFVSKETAPLEVIVSVVPTVLSPLNITSGVALAFPAVLFFGNMKKPLSPDACGCDIRTCP